MRILRYIRTTSPFGSLDWQRLQPLVFTAADSLSFGYVSYARTWLNIRGGRPLQPATISLTQIDGPGVVYNQELELVRGEDDVLYGPMEHSTPTNAEPKNYSGRFKSSPDDARRQYIQFRQGNWRSGAEEEIEYLEKENTDCQEQLRENANIARELETTRRVTQLTMSEEADCKERLRECGRVAREIQVRQAAIAVRLRRLGAIDFVECHPEFEHLDAEFDRLLALPGIAGAGVVGDEVSLLFKARYSLRGVRYDLGDWEIRIKWDMLQTTELRSGVRPQWSRNSAPVYRISGQFCFGALKPLIVEHLKIGQALEAVELAVNAMQSINRGDVGKVHEAFQRETPSVT